MGEIRFVGTGKTRGYPYPVCKKRFVGTGETRGYPYLVCKKYHYLHVFANSFRSKLNILKGANSFGEQILSLKVLERFRRPGYEKARFS